MGRLRENPRLCRGLLIIIKHVEKSDLFDFVVNIAAFPLQIVQL
jgi:hypothetical protein